MWPSGEEELTPNGVVRFGAEKFGYRKSIGGAPADQSSEAILLTAKPARLQESARYGYP
jgi:hypothetical protein